MKRTIILITGATHSCGSAFAAYFAEHLCKDSCLVLTSRSAERLRELKDKIDTKKCKIVTVVLELNHPSKEYFMKELFDKTKLKAADYERAIFIHNAASLGSVEKRVIDMDDAAHLQEHFNINVCSTLLINSLFLHHFKQCKRTVVNMSSASAVRPSPCFGYSALVKPANKMVLNVLMLEEKDVKVLHFDPIGVDSQSLRQIRDKAHDAHIRTHIAEFYDEGKVLTGEAVARVLGKGATNNYKTFYAGKTLEEDTFVSGSTVNGLGEMSVYKS